MATKDKNLGLHAGKKSRNCEKKVTFSKHLTYPPSYNSKEPSATVCGTVDFLESETSGQGRAAR